MDGSPSTGARDWQARARCRDIDPEVFFPAELRREAAARLRAS